MLPTPRRSSPTLRGMVSSAWLRAVDGPRPRASACLPRLETLEERLLLSNGSDVAGIGSTAAAGDASTSAPKSQVVQMNVSTLVAEGIPVPVQPGGVRDGQVSVLRFDNYLL